MSNNTHIYFIHYNGETKQECNQILKICPNSSFTKVSIANLWDKQQQTVFWDFNWPAYWRNKYCYRVWRSYCNICICETWQWTCYMFCLFELTAMKEKVVRVHSETCNGVSKFLLKTGLWYFGSPPWYKKVHPFALYMCMYISVYMCVCVCVYILSHT